MEATYLEATYLWTQDSNLSREHYSIRGPTDSERRIDGSIRRNTVENVLGVNPAPRKSSRLVVEAIGLQDSMNTTRISFISLRICCSVKDLPKNHKRPSNRR
jgi:hypothetical protein